MNDMERQDLSDRRFDVLLERLEPAPPPRVGAVFRREGDFWTIAYEGTLFRLRDIKGLRYIATLNKGKATVALQAVDENHPFYALYGNDNVIAFFTNRYKKSPLIIQGPGAGAEVTAAGVFADILRTATNIL